MAPTDGRSVPPPRHVHIDDLAVLIDEDDDTDDTDIIDAVLIDAVLIDRVVGS